jgi:hypothetical protein
MCSAESAELRRTHFRSRDERVALSPSSARLGRSPYSLCIVDTSSSVTSRVHDPPLEPRRRPSRRVTCSRAMVRAHDSSSIALGCSGSRTGCSATSTKPRTSCRRHFSAGSRRIARLYVRRRPGWSPSSAASRSIAGAAGDVSDEGQLLAGPVVDRVRMGIASHACVCVRGWIAPNRGRCKISAAHAVRCRGLPHPIRHRAQPLPRSDKRSRISPWCSSRELTAIVKRVVGLTHRVQLQSAWRRRVGLESGRRSTGAQPGTGRADRYDAR